MKTIYLFLLGFLFGCMQKGDWKPEDPVWGKEACGHCNMLVSEQHPAAQAVLSDGMRRHFDDVGCLVLFLEREKAPPKAMWVNDGKGGWVPTEKARFAAGQRTPMDFGFLAEPTGSLSFEEVRQAVKAGKKGPP